MRLREVQGEKVRRDHVREVSCTGDGLFGAAGEHGAYLPGEPGRSFLVSQGSVESTRAAFGDEEARIAADHVLRNRAG